MSILVGDNIEFAINYYSLRGLINIESIKWEPLDLGNIPMNIDNTDKQDFDDPELEKKIIKKQARICELEDSQDWRDFNWEKKDQIKVFNFGQFKHNFLISNISFSDFDIFAFRVNLIGGIKDNNDFLYKIRMHSLQCFWYSCKDFRRK